MPATLGPRRLELPLGDHVASIVDVTLGEREDFKDRTQKKPCFIWKVDVWVDGEWKSQKLYTPTYFTDMNQTPKPKAQFVSGLNKLVRACGFQVPQTDEACAAWNEEDLCGHRFVWRVEEDPETGEKVRKILPYKEGGMDVPTEGPPPAAPAKPKPGPAKDVFADDDDED